MKLTTFHTHDTVQKLAVMVASGLITAVALNLFLTPAHVFQAGVTGVAQLLSLFAQSVTHRSLDITGILIL